MAYTRKISRPIAISAETQPALVNPTVLLSLADYAKRHHLSTGTLLNVLHSGRIIPVLFGPEGIHYFIDLSKYDTYQFGRWPKNRPQLTDDPDAWHLPKQRGKPKMIDPRRMVSPADFARMRKYSRSHVTTMIGDGRIVPTLIGPHKQYSFIDLDQYESMPMGRGK